MSPKEKEKLAAVFHEKYMDLAFSFNSHGQIWSSYLESVNCAQRSARWVALSENYYMEFVPDPSPFNDGYIQVPEETALKILVLGLP